MANLIEFNDLNNFFEYNKNYLEANYISHYNLIKMLEMANRGQFDVIDAFNIEDGAGCSIICLAVTEHLLIYSTEWNIDMIEELEKRVPLNKLKGYQFMGQRALVTEILNRNKISYEIIKDRLVYECSATNNVDVSTGRMEQSDMKDLEELGQMSFDYHNEEYKNEPGGRSLDYMTNVAKKSIEHGVLYNWLDNGICCMASIVNPNEPLPVIGQLFTKVKQRNQGYACSLLHTLTNQQLDGGAEKCGLMSDATNPASNKVFEKVGYRPVYDLILCIENSTTKPDI